MRTGLRTPGRGLSFGLHLAGYRGVLILCDSAWLSSYINRDVRVVEAVPVDGQVLTATGITLMSADV